MVKASDLNPAWGDDAVAVMAEHVREKLEPDAPLVNFTLLDGVSPIEGTELLFQSDVHALTSLCCGSPRYRRA